MQADLSLDSRQQNNRSYDDTHDIEFCPHPQSGGADIENPKVIDFKMVGFKKRLNPEIETVLYRLSQEALTNTLKHSGAKHFKLSIIKSYPHIIFAAEDDGVGFETSEFIKHKDTLGLLSMRERASMLGGSFSLRASKGKGTHIRIKIPLNESRHE